MDRGQAAAPHRELPRLVGSTEDRGAKGLESGDGEPITVGSATNLSQLARTQPMYAAAVLRLMQIQPGATD